MSVSLVKSLKEKELRSRETFKSKKSTEEPTVKEVEMVG